MSLNFGVVYPQTEYPPDPAAVRDYAQTAEALGYSHIVAYDHVLGANPERPGGWKGPYTQLSAFLEPFVLYSFMAACTTQLGFMTGILILPQRQTALVAKQAATLDVLSGGRLRLGVGLGWNEVEYVALGENFHDRGRRMEEQLEVLRRLWTEPLVSFQGREHHIDDAGWIPTHRSAADARSSLEKLGAYLGEQGRSLEGFGLEARLPYGDGDPASWLPVIEGWRRAGATHIGLNTMGAGLAA